jgi:TPP-dependent 2-oxoacid decarboxylase
VQEKISPKDASLKAYRRIYAPEAPFGAPEPSAPLVMRVVNHTVQSLLSDSTSLILETGDSWFQGQRMRLPQGCNYEFQMQYGSIGWYVHPPSNLPP